MYLNEIVGESAICINCQPVVAERSRKVAASKILIAKKKGTNMSHSKNEREVGGCYT